MRQGGVGTGVPVEQRYRVELGREWWVAVVAVPAILGVIGAIGAGDGFLHVFLWSVVAFCIGTVIALVVAALVVPAETDPVGRVVATGTASARSSPGSEAGSTAGRVALRARATSDAGESR
jgi:hypothetical protein